MADMLYIAQQTLEVPAANKSEVLRYLGYKGQAIGADLEAKLDATVQHARALARPRFAARSFPVHAGTTSGGTPCLKLEGTTCELAGHDIANHLAGASEVVVLALTLGAAIDRELRLLSHTDAAAEVMFDASATMLIERAADAVNAEVIAYAAAKDQYCSWRFSPGYGDLSLTSQPALLAALDAERKLGLTLTDTNLMVPTKSVTALIGIHPEPQQGAPEACSICNFREFCTLRLSGRTCRG